DARVVRRGCRSRGVPVPRWARTVTGRSVLGSRTGGLMADQAGHGRKADPGSAAAWLHSDGDPGDGRNLRGTLRMVVGALRLIWQGARRDFLVVTAMELLQAAGTFVFIIQIQQIISRLLTSKDGNSLSLTLNLLLFIFANVLMGIAGTIISNRRQIIGEKMS